MPEENSKDNEVPEQISLKKLSESCSLAITKVDEKGKIYYASDEAKKLFRLDGEDVKSVRHRELGCDLIDFHGNEYYEEDLPHKITQETGEPVKDVKVALEWPDGERRYLSICSFPLFGENGNFEAALNLIRDISKKNKESKESLPRRAQFESLLRELSRRFLERGTEKDRIINEGLEKIGKFLGVDRTYVFEFDWEKEEMSNSHEWCIQGVEPQIHNLQSIPNSRFTALMEKLEDRENVLINDVSDLPESWQEEKEVFISGNIQSLLLVPISRGDKLYGFTGFDSVRRNRDWGEEEVNLLRIFGNLLGSAYFRRRLKKRSEKKKSRLKLALEGGDLGTWDWNVPTEEFKFDRRWAEMKGYDPDELKSSRKTWEDMIHPDDLPKARSKLNKHLEGKTDCYEAEFRMQHKSGEWIWVLERGRLVERDEQGDPVRMAGTQMDITERKRTERALDEERKKLKNLHSAVDELQRQDSEREMLQVAVDVAQNILDFNFCAISTIEGGYLIPRANSSDLDTVETKIFEIGEGIAGKTAEEGETIWGDDVRNYPEAESTKENFRSYISVPIGDLGVLQVISREEDSFSERDVELVEVLANHLREELKRVRLEEELTEQAIRDPLTGLYNRRYFNETLKKEVQKSQRYEEPLAFLMLDIDKFKEVNDRYSHQTGDEVLRKVAELLKDNFRGADTVVRYGGDEFLVMLPETNGEVENTVERVNQKLKKWNEQSDLLDFDLSLAIGYSHWSPEQDRDVEKSLKEADEKMYENKSR